MPIEDVYLRFRLSKAARVSMELTGTVTREGIDKFIAILELMKDTFPPTETDEGSKLIEDGFGSSWSVVCPACHQETMQVIKPGTAQCANCG